MLTAREVATITKPGRHHDQAGLYLHVRASGARSWVLVFMRRRKQRYMGLGRVRLGAELKGLTLAEARAKATDAHRLLDAGVDPIVARKQAPRAAVVARSFKEVAEQYIDAKASGWRNPKTAATWRGAFAGHVYPGLGALPVNEITTNDVTGVLTKIWHVMPSTAGRLRSRIAAVLDAAKARGFIQGDNPANWKTINASGLSAPDKVRAPQHRPAMAYTAVPKFMKELEQRNGIAARALAFTILTAARTAETITATWADIDLDKKVWVVPAAKIKTGVEHHVPLSDAVLAILKALPREAGNDYVFVGGRRGRGLSNVMQLKILKAMRPGLTVHGFRSSFRTWAADRTDVPREVAEAALGHAAGGAVELAYMRSTFWEKRVALMATWAAFCERR
jgi:integrase